MVLFVRKAILRSVHLKMFIMYEFSLPMCETGPFLGGFWNHWLGWFKGVGFVEFNEEGVVL
jgi:hypothetical protein